VLVDHLGGVAGEVRGYVTNQGL